MQKYTSKATSINSARLPSAIKKIDWEQYKGSIVLDIGGGKFNNVKDYLLNNYNITLYIYDPYNRSKEENDLALSCKPTLVICNNVLNVIDSDESIIELIKLVISYSVSFVFSIYEGDKTGVPKVTGKDQYQRNQKTKDYLKFFGDNIILKKGMIIG